MTPTPIYPLSKIAAGWNNTGSLTAWETIRPSANDPYFFPPMVYGLYLAGQEEGRPTGMPFFGGYPSAGVLWSAITQSQVYYLMTTYCSAGYNYGGLVTVEFRKENPDSYVIANAVLRLPQFANSSKKSRAFENYKAMLLKLVIIA